MEEEIVCKVRTQQAENFDEEVKSLVSAWRSVSFPIILFSTSGIVDLLSQDWREES